MADHEMICTCSPEGLRAAIELRLEVQHRLGVERAEDTWTAAVLSLAWQFGQEIDVLSDMWFGVGIYEVPDTRSEYVECDHPCDGVFFLWRLMADKYPEQLTVIGSHPDNADARQKNNLILEDYIVRRIAYENHVEVCTSCETSPKYKDKHILCSSGKALWDDKFVPVFALADMWSAPKYEIAPRMWGLNET